MKRKMLISIALITIMLLNCILPIFSVYAETGEEIQLNSNLYKAVKASLAVQEIAFTFDDITHTLTLSSESKANVKELNLNEGSISDLTGLDKFTELTHLELSGNSLTKDSNLSVLNSLSNLNYLDLSSNQIEDVSAISSLINNLKTKGTIILSGQIINIVESVYVDTEEDSNNEETATFELPSILELAGYIKSCWKSVKCTPEEDGGIAPFLSVDSIPMYVNSENKKISINISSEKGDPYLGLAAVTIKIYDDPTEAANAKNPNKAAENILKDSTFNLYYVVFDKSSEAITTMDTNLYNAIKSQLTGGQTINKNLSSYPYAVDSNGNTIYEEFIYTNQTIGDVEYRILTNAGTKQIQYILDTETNFLYEFDGTTIGNFVNVKPEEITISDISEVDGTVTIKAGYRIPFIDSEAGKDLYIVAYDDAKTFVINDIVLTNKITSLQLNNKQIRDLSGIEFFIGLTSDLNVSHNYLNNIDSLYNLEAQKANWEAQIVAKYKEWLNGRTYGSLSSVNKEIKDAEKIIEDNEKLINNAYNQIVNILVSAGEVDSTKEKYTEVLDTNVTAISKVLESVYGSTTEDGKRNPGYFELIKGYMSGDEEVDGAIDNLNSNVSLMYSYLQHLYVLYNEEYKLTTLLSDNVNYLTYDEYNAYKEKTTTTTEAAKALVNEEISYLSKLESEGALSELDKALLTQTFGIDFEDKKTETPLADYFKDYMEKTPLNRVDAVELLDNFRKIGIYSEMANYCLIKRMNEETPSKYCYEEEYLENRIKNFETEDIPSTLEEDILKNIKEKTIYDNLFKVYKDYTEKTYEYINPEDVAETITVYTCEGEYIKLSETVEKDNNEISTPISVNNKCYDKADLVAKVVEIATNGKKTIDTANVNYVLDKLYGAGATTTIIEDVILKENIYTDKKYESAPDELFLYNQMMNLANKLLNSNVDRYVTLPRLKALNISYNADLDNLNRITELTSLYTLDSSYCYIADVTNVDWASMKNLKELLLAYNFISDIVPLTNLENLKTLDVSNNLLSGKLNITEQQYLKLFNKMKEFNLSGNQISDIESLIIYLDYISGGNYANYLAREDTLNINLCNQYIEINVAEPVILAEYPTTIDIVLPKIFTQLLAIDTERTGFGVTSQNGRIESEGKYVTLNTRTEGAKEGTVVVLPMTGDGSEVTTCIGQGTTAKIKYEVKSNGQKPTDPETGITYKIEYYYDDVVNSTLTEEKKAEKDTEITEETLKENIEKNTLTGYKFSKTNLPLTINENAEENIVKVYYVKNTTEDTTGSIDTGKLGYTVKEDSLIGIKTKTPISDFKTILLNGQSYDVVILEKEGGEKVTSGYLKTGMLIRIEKDGQTVKNEKGELAVYEVVVKGDVNGDGYANSLDSNLIKAYRNEVTKLEEVAKEAADINSDGNVNITDSKLLLYHRAEVKDYNLDFVNNINL